MRTGIFVNDSLPQEAKEVLGSYDVFERQADDSSLSECRVLMAWPARASRDLIVRMRSLRMLQSLAAGVDALDFSALQPGVRVFSNAGAYTETVAEHAWGLLLGAAKGVHIRNSRVAPRALRGKVLLVVGCGGIGSEVARLSRSLGMKTVGVSRSFRDPAQFDEKRGLGELREAMGSADAVVVALPLTSLTRGVFDGEVLSNAKESVVIVNVGRGALVDEASLLSWLEARLESRYVTDVFWKKDGKEVFDVRAWDLPNFAGTLHVAGAPLGESNVKGYVRAAANVRRFLETGEADNEVDLSEYASGQ